MGKGGTARIVHPAALTDADKAGWEALRAAHADYDSPLLSPEFAQVAGRDRSDARVALISDAQGLAAILAVHARPDGLGRPIGAPFCDYAGPIVRADCTWRLVEIVAMAGLGGYRTQALLDPWNRFIAERRGGTVSHMIRMTGASASDYLESRRAAYPKRFKNFRRLENQMVREGHVLRLTWGAMTAALREPLFAFKSAQYRSTGLCDLMTAPRARHLLDKVEASPFGFQVGLWSGHTLVSADFGFRVGKAFHPWIAAFNPDFGHYSPGNLLQKNVIEHLPDMGIEHYDLAEGHDHYKKYFTNAGRTIYRADVAVPGWKGLAIAVQAAGWRLAGADREGSPAGRLRRRIDQAAISFDRTIDRVGDLALAFRRRGVSAPVAGHAPDDE